MAEQLSRKDARSLNLHALGLETKAARGTTPLDVLDQLTVLQLDSVNVFERAHYMPVFSRIGAFDRNLLDTAALPVYEKSAEDAPANQRFAVAKQPALTEFWVRQASWIRTDDLPLWRFRMGKSYRARRHQEFINENAKLVAWLKEELADRGPLTLKDFEHDMNKRTGNWWGWSPAKVALEYLFATGEITNAGRHNFARRYALPEHVFEPEFAALLASTDFDADELERTTIERAIRAEGVTSLAGVGFSHSDYPSQVKPFVQQLVEAGRVIEVDVEGWSKPGYVHADWLPKLAAGDFVAPTHTTILSPFDPLVRVRERAIDLFGFDYKIEIYVPEPKRVYGYYTLPVLHKGELIGRLDLKSDRKAKALLVQSSWHEEWMSAAKVKSAANAVMKNLTDAAKWQGLDQILIAPKGNFADALSAAQKAYKA
ncbi:MAG: hypothetical protein RL016_483 [Actinomycetota bacterium]